MASALLNGEAKGKEGDCSTSISGLQVAIVIDGNEVIRECRETCGTGYLISDEDVWEMQRRLTSAQRITCLVTGSDFMDSESVKRIHSDCACPIVEAVCLESLR